MLQKEFKSGSNGLVRFGYDKITGEEVAVKILNADQNDALTGQYPYFSADAVEATKRGTFYYCILSLLFFCFVFV